jgi:hypothetical protein
MGGYKTADDQIDTPAGGVVAAIFLDACKNHGNEIHKRHVSGLSTGKENTQPQTSSKHINSSLSS